MRVWLVDDKRGERVGRVEALLRQLEEHPGADIRLLGASPFQPDFADAMRKLIPDLLDVLVINESAWPQGAGCEEIFGLGMAVLIVTPFERVSRFHNLAHVFPIGFASPTADVESFSLALLGAWTSRCRQIEHEKQLQQLQQRLRDRIVIERAKGVLVQRLGISEEEAYRRLRILSRRQRRQIRDIAQSLLDTQVLLLPEAAELSSNGDKEPNGECRPEAPLEGLLASDV